MARGALPILGETCSLSAVFDDDDGASETLRSAGTRPDAPPARPSNPVRSSSRCARARRPRLLDPVRARVTWTLEARNRNVFRVFRVDVPRI